MEAKSSNHQKQDSPNRVDSCGTNSTFNFTVGAIAIVVAGIFGYFVYTSFMQ